jgi:hypothetical protein
MIARVWHGSTKPEHADAYESHLKPELLPGLSQKEGFRGRACGPNRKRQRGVNALTHARVVSASVPSKSHISSLSESAGMDERFGW